MHGLKSFQFSEEGIIKLYIHFLYLGIDIGFKLPNESVEEDEGVISLCVELQDGRLERSVMVFYQIVTEGKVVKISTIKNKLHALCVLVAIEGVDFESPIELVNFDPSNNMKACSFINLTIIDDLRLEGNEYLFVEILRTDPESPFVVVTQSSTSILIIDNDSKSMVRIIMYYNL